MALDLRTVVLDTETTGGSARQGDRVVDLGMVEMLNGRRTGRVWQGYFNPGRKNSPFAQRIHGLSDAFLSKHGPFEGRAVEIREFLGDSMFLAHNASFDFAFMAAEFRLSSVDPGFLAGADTIFMAKQVLPGGKHGLDSVVERLQLDVPHRRTHGALLDATILAQAIEVMEELSPGLTQRCLARKIRLQPQPSQRLGRMHARGMEPDADTTPDAGPAPGIGL